MSEDNGWTFFTFVLRIVGVVGLKRPKINEKRGRGWPIIFLKKHCSLYCNERHIRSMETFKCVAPPIPFVY